MHEDTFRSNWRNDPTTIWQLNESFQLMIKVYFKLNDVLCMKYHVTFDPKHLSGSE